MQTPKNGFQSLNLQPKKHIVKQKITFFMYFCLSNTISSDAIEVGSMSSVAAEVMAR